MSITGVSAVSLLEPTLLEELEPSPTQAATIASTTAVATISATTTAAANDANSLSALTTDLVSLLKSLVAGDVGVAKSDLAKVQTDLQAQNAAGNGVGDATTSPLGKLVAAISTSLSNGSTHGALNALASYLVATGLGTGSLVNTTA